MSGRLWTERIEDILEAIAEIQAFTQSMNFEDFQADARTVKAVALNFIVIGEAATHIPDNITDSHQEIAWYLMRGMRNRLVHDYFGMDPQVMWDTIRNDLSPLVEPLQKILDTA